ncbi:MAG: YlxM family DNA-binding protein [Ruminococcus sp.]|nr:YlxM family DNA-binding protein [Ruminococcus sp.]
MEKNIEVSLLLDFYGQLLPESGRQMTDLYYNDDLSLAEIAEQCGITRQGVRDKIKRCEIRLFSFEEKLGLLSRFQQLEQGLERISADARDIYVQTDDSKIKAAAKSIEQTADSLKE